jgi:hypothetical protein
MSKNELWLEFGKINSDGWHDLFWYNEGRWQELPYFIKNFIGDIFTKNRYYYIRYGNIRINLRGKKHG